MVEERITKQRNGSDSAGGRLAIENSEPVERWTARSNGTGREGRRNRKEPRPSGRAAMGVHIDSGRVASGSPTRSSLPRKQFLHTPCPVPTATSPPTHPIITISLLLLQHLFNHFNHVRLKKNCKKTFNTHFEPKNSAFQTFLRPFGNIVLMLLSFRVRVLPLVGSCCLFAAHQRNLFSCCV